MQSAFPRHRTALVAGLLFLGTFLLFSRSLGFAFVNYDDPRYVYQNPNVLPGFTLDSVRWAFTGHGDIWNPLVRLTHILDWSLFGDAPHGHHLQNILWHALAASLVFLLARRLGGGCWTAALFAAVFAWHPLRVESVSWVSERKDVVSVVFGLLTLLAHTAYAERRARRAPAGARYLLMLGAFVAALLAKPSMVTLPGVLLLLDGWPLRRFGFARPRDTTTTALPPAEPARALFLEKLPFVALACAAAYITVHTQTAAGDFVLELPLGARLANALVSLPRYVGMFFWPFGLCVAYPHPGWWPLWIVVGAALLVAAAVGAAWSTRHTMPWIAVGLLWYLGMLLPMIGIVQVGFQSIADRYTYFPILGLQLALFWSIRAWLARRALPRGLVPAAATVLLAGLAWRTVDQQKFWADSTALYEHALAVTRRNDVAHSFLAYTCATNLKPGPAREQCEKSLALNPRNRLALLTRARLNAAEHRTAEAIADFRNLTSFSVRDRSARIDLAFVLYSSGHPDEAVAELGRIPRETTEWPVAQIALAQIHADHGRLTDAIDTLAAAAADHPADSPLLEKLAPLLHQAGRDTEAAALFAHALDLRPRSPELLRARAVFLHATGQPAAAVTTMERAVALAPRDWALHREYGQLLANLGRYDEALAVFERILDRAPTFAPAAYDCARLHEKRGEAALALGLYRQAVAAQPNIIPAHIAIARLAEAQGRPQEADAAFRQALELAPGDAALHCTYAEVLARRQQFDGALDHYRRATELAPDYAEAHAGLGYMLAFSGRRREAIAQWETVLRLNPEFPGLRETIEKVRRQLK